MDQILQFFTGNPAELFLLFVKSFAILFSFLYLLYAVVITRQTQVMNRTFMTNSRSILLFVAFLQILFALFLIFVSITLL